MALDLRRRLAGRVYYGWVVVGACLLAATATFGTSYTFSVSFDAFIEEFGVGRGPLGFVFGLQTALLFTGGLAAGRAVDRYGGRRVAAVSGVLLFADRHADVGADPAVEFEDCGAGGAGTGADGVATPSPELPDETRETVLSGPFLLVFLGWTCIYAPIYVLLSHVVLYATHAGFGRSTGVFAITVLGVTIVLARLGVGALSDRVGRVATFVASGALVGLGLLALPLAPTATAFLGGIVASAVGYSGTGSLLSSILADLFGNEGLNTMFGVASLAFGVAGLTAPPLAGYWFETAGSYGPPFGAFRTVGLVGAGCIVLAARLRGDG
jgi:MFS family permease